MGRRLRWRYLYVNRHTLAKAVVGVPTPRTWHLALDAPIPRDLTFPIFLLWVPEILAGLFRKFWPVHSLS
jgi:hypothetical protein